MWAKATIPSELRGFRFFSLLRRMGEVSNDDSLGYVDDLNYISFTVWDAYENFQVRCAPTSLSKLQHHSGKNAKDARCEGRFTRADFPGQTCSTSEESGRL